MATDGLIVYCTLPDNEHAPRIARALVDAKLAACVNLLPGMVSIYRWQGQICDEPERLAIIKTTVDRYEAMRARLVELHPYDCPEVIAFPIDRGHAPYLDWIRESTR